LLAYEGFSYPAGANLAGLNGGTGWNGGWVDVAGGGGVTVNAGNLVAGASAPSGYDARSTGNSVFVNNANRYGRLMDCSANGTFGAHGYIDANGHLGAAGKVMYISFLQQAGATVGGAFYEFEFHRGNLSDPGRIGGIGNDTGVANSINLRAPDSVNNLSLGVADTAVNFYVLKIVYDASGLDDIYVYRNPMGATEGANTPTLTALAQADMSFDGISLAAFNSSATEANDQIRLGESWADVVGGPPGFIVQPQGFMANVGNSNALTALAVSDLPINYQWYHGGSAIANATNTSFTLTNIAFSSGGSYTVIASNSLGSVTSVVATVSVLSNTNFLLGYEGFNYSAGVNLAALNGGIGWSNGWVDVYGGGGGTVSAGNLVAWANAPNGYDARSTGNSSFVSNNNRYGRWLDCSANGNFALFGLLDANGNIGADGTTIYVSFLQQPSSTSTFYEFEFHRGNLGDPGRIAGIGNDLNSTTVNFRAPDTTQTPIGPGSTNVNFYVVRIDFQPGNDDVYVYRNPTGSSESDNQPTLTMLGVADMSFNGISLAAFFNNVTSFSCVTVKHDEIRLGLTWSDVLGGPPEFVLQPANQNLYVGQTAVFTALAQSKQPVTYQWYYGSNSLSGMTNASLMVTYLQLTNAGAYSVMASNALGVATSSVAALTVQSIGVSIPVQSLTVVPGSNLVVTATYGGTQPVSFQWFQDGTALSGQTNSTLSIGNVDNFDAGQYVLVANNGYGSVTSSVVSVCANLGGILAYEGFSYPVGGGDLIGQNSGIGWNGAWANINGSSGVTSGSILSGSLPVGTNGPAGYNVHSLGNAAFQPNGSRSGCFLDCSTTGNFAAHGYIDANGNIGADGKTVYVSFLQQPNTTGQFYEFEFHRGDLGDGGRMAGVGNDVGDSHVHFRVETPAGGSSTFSDLGPGSTNVNFYVVQIDYKGGNDNVYVYRNPTGTNEAANVPVATILGAGDMSFNGISLAAYNNGLTVSHDEIRMGISWADVVGNNSNSQLQFTQRLNGNSWIRFAGSPNNAFNLQGASIVTGPWTNITQIIVPATGSGNVVESNTFDSQRFYRAVTNPTLPSVNPVLADFDESTYGTWVTTGTAFGIGPAQGTLTGQNTVSGYLGSGLANSFYGGDSSTGTLTSPPFTITKHYISFYIGGGNFPGQECLNLLVNGVVVRTATGSNSDTLVQTQWDASAYLGQSAVLQIVDTATGSFGHILVDQIIMTDTSLPVLSGQMVLTNNLLNLPVKNGSTSRRVTITVGGIPIRDFNIDLADGAPDWWAFTDVSAFQGQTATISANGLPAGSTGLSSIVQSNGIVGATNLYQETLRPQIHFSSKRGWLNDANGMVYYKGQYHLYYQHDPFNYNGTDQKFWGHAVSPDMVHWQELPEAIYPYSYGDWVWSGSAVIDTANTGGFKTGTNDVIVASFYSTARGQCIAFSNDGGLTFTDYTNNPVVTVPGRDPHMLWYAPSNYWVMAVYDSNLNGIDFFTTPDFHTWTYRSGIAGFAECPDIFELPVDGNTNNMLWEINGGSASYMLGNFNGAVFSPTTSMLPGDNGSGFYASQTFTTMPPGDSRRVRIGWAQISMPNMPFNQMMYFPTELTLQTTSNGVRLCSVPVREIQNLHANQYFWTNLTLNTGFNPLSGIRGTLFDLNAQFAAGSAQAITFTFQGVTVTYNATIQQISCNGVTNPLPPINGVVQLEIIVDRDTIEIFGNNGQLYMPLPASNASGNSLISLSCTGGTATFNSLAVNKLKSIWTGLSQ
jgi:fructan beta-fructosidase